MRSPISHRAFYCARLAPGTRLLRRGGRSLCSAGRHLDCVVLDPTQFVWADQPMHADVAGMP
eukprot:7858712-Pyramimonas_sp.AAC.1